MSHFGQSKNNYFWPEKGEETAEKKHDEETEYKGNSKVTLRKT